MNLETLEIGNIVKCNCGCNDMGPVIMISPTSFTLLIDGLLNWFDEGEIRDYDMEIYLK